MKNTSLLANIKKQPGFIMLVNFLVMMAIYMLSRWFFYYMNINSFKDVTLSEMMSISWGGLRFDACALCYLNALCILLQFLPIKCRHTAVYLFRVWRTPHNSHHILGVWW